jgi:rhodanese-related sulfurtransferase
MLNADYNRTIILLVSLILAGCAGKGSVENTGEVDVAPIELAPNEFKSKLASTPKAVLVDVRTPEEVAEGMIEGAINIDYKDDSFAEKIGSLDKTIPYFLYCKSGKRSGDAASEMERLGFEKVYVLEGGYIKWQQNGLDLKRND